MTDSMSMSELYEKVNQGISDKEIILDVRGPDEFRSGHIPGSRNVPLDQLESKIDELKSFEKVYVHCQMGGRAQMAATILQSKGLENLVCIGIEGMKAWIDAGYPVER